ncbi:hypothetical protein LOTGIDRAFT_115858, partial [Lottia gigantea]
GVILTHGAGGDMNTKQLVLFSEQLAKDGFLVLRFTCKGLNLIHRSNIYLHVLVRFKQTSMLMSLPYSKPFLMYEKFGMIKEGRSMGSRAAVDVANRIKDDSDLKDFVTGVICISYPLYPAKDKLKIRDKPIQELNKPVLFISGSKDEMCAKDTLLDTLSQNKNVSFYWVEEAEHSLEGKGLNLEDTVRQACDKIGTWFKGLGIDLCTSHVKKKAVKRKSIK